MNNAENKVDGVMRATQQECHIRGEIKGVYNVWHVGETTQCIVWGVKANTQHEALEIAESVLQEKYKDYWERCVDDGEEPWAYLPWRKEKLK